MLAILLMAVVACTKEPTPDPVYPGGGGSGGGNSGGNESVSNVPTGLSATVIGSQIKVSWNEVQVPKTFHYKVYRASNSSGPYICICSTTATYFYDDSPNTNNYYKVTATDWNLNESEMSNYVYCHY